MLQVIKRLMSGPRWSRRRGRYTAFPCMEQVEARILLSADVGAAATFVAGIDLEKLTNGVDADDPTGPALLVGSPVTWTYRVSNTGDVALGGVAVSDDQGVIPLFQSGDGDNNGVLDVDEIWIYEATGTAQAGQYTNLADVVATPVDAAGDPLRLAYTALFADRSTTWTDSADLPQFDPALGTLTSVEVTSAVVFTTEFSVESQDRRPSTIETTVAGEVTLTGPGVGTALDVALSEEGATFDAAASDDVLDFDGPSGKTFDPQTASDTSSILLTSSADLALYNGTGTVSFTERAEALSAVSGSGNLVTLILTTAEGLITVEYAFDVRDSDRSHYIGQASASLGDYVWEDVNGNGQQDDGDTGVPGVTVNLLDASMVQIPGATTLTSDGTTDVDGDGTLDPAGSYFFGGLAPGDYFVEFVTPAGSALTTPNVGDDTIDSDAVDQGDGTGKTGVINLSSGEYDDTNDAGLIGPQAAIDIEKATNGEDADSPTGPVLPVGATATFTYVVTNTGNVPLDSVLVTDDNGTPGDASDDLTPTFVGGDSDGDGLLDLTETWTYTADRLVTAGQYTNVSDVVGNPVDDGGTDIPGLDDVVDADPSNHYGELHLPEAAIDIEKLVRPVIESGGGEGLTPGFWKTHSRFGPAPESGWPATGLDPTDSYERTFGVNAPGNKTLLKALGTGGGGAKALLRHSTAALLNAMNPNVDYAFTAAEVVALVQQAFATDAFESIKNGFAQENERGADLSTPAGGGTAAVAFEDADDPTGPLVAVGDQVEFRYIVTNPGEVELADVQIVDDNATPGDAGDDFGPGAILDGGGFNVGDTDADNRLDVGETWQYAAISTVIDEGQFKNIGVVTGTPVDAAGAPVGDPVTDADPAHWLVGGGGEDPPPTGGQGLTPGFWKQPQHFQFWAGVKPSDSINDIFGVDDPDAPTLLEALRRGGGGHKALGRHAVAALLNAANPDVAYAFTEDEIIAMVRSAYATGDYDPVKDRLAQQNELHGVELK